MQCRPKCGACCIALSISSPIPGMPNGKTAGTTCIHLDEHFNCKIFHSPDRPQVCTDLKPSPSTCGDNQQHALQLLHELEQQTKP
ncbi:MAG: YkgJ family cysteine cluster protein [Gammaproteobacteria bacterium]|nr:YkgJ family cysteine cluster protein [Gammaproteobacteria bacterium]MDH5729282.1 YkgJ family cysteine cluster protein [Gammaproteobacteria bacterium]